MTNETAAVPPTAAISRRYTESMSLFVDPLTRAYTLGTAMLLAKRNGWATPRESEVVRALLDESIANFAQAFPDDYLAAIEAGRAEMARREAARA